MFLGLFYLIWIGIINKTLNKIFKYKTLLHFKIIIITIILELNYVISWQ